MNKNLIWFLFIYINSNKSSALYCASQFPLDRNKTMTFDIADRASDCYWKILAERTRLKLDEELQENRQVRCLK